MKNSGEWIKFQKKNVVIRFPGLFGKLWMNGGVTVVSEIKQ